MLTNDEPYCAGWQELKPKVGVALTPLQVMPALLIQSYTTQLAVVLGEVDHHDDDVVLHDLTSLALGDPGQVDHHDVNDYAPTFGRDEHFPGRDGGHPSLEAKDRLRLSLGRRRREEHSDGNNT